MNIQGDRVLYLRFASPNSGTGCVAFFLGGRPRYSLSGVGALLEGKVTAPEFAKSEREIQGRMDSLYPGALPKTAEAPANRTAVEVLADSYRGLPPNERPLTVACLETPSGSFGGRSSYAGEAHPVVQKLVAAYPGRFNGACAECDAISQALLAQEAAAGQPITTIEQARQALAGSSIQTARVRGPNSAAHGTPISPCETCQPLLDDLGITYR
jgi:YwqJ-like deaminase